jgi:hypothetical protein
MLLLLLLLCKAHVSVSLVAAAHVQVVVVVFAAFAFAFASIVAVPAPAAETAFFLEFLLPPHRHERAGMAPFLVVLVVQLPVVVATEDDPNDESYDGKQETHDRFVWTDSNPLQAELCVRRFHYYDCYDDDGDDCINIVCLLCRRCFLFPVLLLICLSAASPQESREKKVPSHQLGFASFSNPDPPVLM